jgi:hypothetical protein
MSKAIVSVVGGVTELHYGDALIIDFDNLEDEGTEPSDFADVYCELVPFRGEAWADNLMDSIEHVWRRRHATVPCVRCGELIADEHGTFVDITGGDVCVDSDGVDDEHRPA